MQTDLAMQSLLTGAESPYTVLAVMVDRLMGGVLNGQQGSYRIRRWRGGGGVVAVLWRGNNWTRITGGKVIGHLSLRRLFKSPPQTSKTDHDTKYSMCGSKLPTMQWLTLINVYENE